MYQSARLSMLKAWKYIEAVDGWKREETISGRRLQWRWLPFCSRYGKLTEGKGGKMGPQHSTVYSLRSAYWGKPIAFPVDPPALPHRQETKAVTVVWAPEWSPQLHVLHPSCSHRSCQEAPPIFTVQNQPMEHRCRVTKAKTSYRKGTCLME